jgi:hypothetical protein
VKQPPHQCGYSHRERAPERHAQSASPYRCASNPRGKGTEQYKEHQGTHHYKRRHHVNRRQCRNNHRQDCSPGERNCGSECRLQWAGRCRRRDAKLIARMSTKRVVRHELLGYLFCKRCCQTAFHVYRGEFGAFGSRVSRKLNALAFEVGILGVSLRAYRNVLSSRHGHCTCDQASDAGEKNSRASRPRRGYTYNKARGGEQAIVGTEYRGAKPAYMTSTMSLDLHP